MLKYDIFIKKYERNCKKLTLITNLDWSTDSKYIQSNCGAY
jgi:hypothetical protein